MGFDYAPPKYAQVVAEIKSRIERGQYPPGSLLPSEHQLVSDFGVSRPTIVKALSALRQDGWIDDGLPTAPQREWTHLASRGLRAVADRP